MDILRRERSFQLIDRRDEEARLCRMWACFYVEGDPNTFVNRLYFDGQFTFQDIADVRKLAVVTLADGRRGVEGDQ